jgi:rare lipoprotein A
MGRFLDYANLSKILAKGALFFIFALALRTLSDLSIVPYYGVASWHYEPPPVNVSRTADYGVASWYHKDSPGVLPTTANMEKFNDKKMTCASWDFPFNTRLEITNMQNGKKVLVRVNDRGPSKRLYHVGRIVDLTKAAFERIEDPDKGLAKIRVRVVK